MSTDLDPKAHLTDRLIARALAATPEHLPDDVLVIAGHCLLDWLSVAVAGWDDPAVTPLRARVGEDPGRPVAMLLGEPLRCRVDDAALVNGVASHALDFDDSHLPSRVHPSAPVWPAVLALGEQVDASGPDMLSAFVAGVEVQSELAAVMGESHYRVGWHNTATLGTFGAAAAAARLWRLDAERTRHALGLAAVQAAGLRMAFGSPAKPFQVGRAAAAGLLAADLARRGTTSADALAGELGYCTLAARELSAAPERAPGDWHASRIVFKYHASCYGTQAPIDAALRVRDAAAPHAWERAEVAVEPQYLSVCNIAEPATGPQAKFSIRHTVALALANRDTTAAASYSAGACHDPALREARGRITVAGDAAMPRANARVTLHLADGSRHEAQVDASLPAADLAEQQRRLRQKSTSLLADRCKQPRTVQDIALDLRSQASAQAWAHALGRALHGAG